MQRVGWREAGLMLVLACAALPAAAGEIIAASDDLLQKARPQAHNVPLRKQLCARLGVDGSCQDGLPSVKQDLLQPPVEDDLPPEPAADLPPVKDLLPAPDTLEDVPPQIVPAAAPPASVPEPSAPGLALLAVAGVLAQRRRRR